MSRASNSDPPFLLGFAEIERAIARPARGGSDGYPPYNIERIAKNGSEGPRLRITLAVAGFAANQIEIIVEREQLLIRGRQKDDRERFHLHRGIATRQFQRVFFFAETMQVARATVHHGLLSVELMPPEPEQT
ncbi:MAG: Hsp20 family protein [Methylocella sp.]